MPMPASYVHDFSSTTTSWLVWRGRSQLCVSAWQHRQKWSRTRLMTKTRPICLHVPPLWPEMRSTMMVRPSCLGFLFVSCASQSSFIYYFEICFCQIRGKNRKTLKLCPLFMLFNGNVFLRQILTEMISSLPHVLWTIRNPDQWMVRFFYVVLNFFHPPPPWRVADE